MAVEFSKEFSMTTELNTKSESFDHIKAPAWNPGGVGQESAPMAKSFRDFHLSDEIYRALDAVGYSSPTPVQAACTPLILAGIDLIVQAQTGTGKTAAFAIPSVEMLEPGQCKVEVLVLAPTRELAKQVGGEFERIGGKKNIPVACVYGGTGFTEQLEALKTAQVVCATPGRLLDLLKRKAMTLDNLKIFILDEADEMLNMGFEKELTAIVERLPATRQSLLFSATVSDDIKQLAGGMLSFPEYVSLSSDQVAAEEVHHSYFNVSGMGRLWDLTRVVELENPENAIVFCNTREDSFLVANFLRKQGYKAEVLNGDLPQRDREATLAKLKANQIQFLVATDVAARGIDISDLTHVLNYTLPESPETYIHRTGRTGRAGKRGVAISLISPREVGTYYILRRVYKMVLEERELPSPEDFALLKQRRGFDQTLAQINILEADENHVWLAEELLKRDDAKDYVSKLIAGLGQAVEAPVVEEIVIDEVSLRARPSGFKKNSLVKKIERPAPKRSKRDDAASVASEDSEPDSSQRRRRRSGAPEQSEGEDAKVQSTSDEGAEEGEASQKRRRRRRRRRSSGDAPAPAEAVEATEEQESPRKDPPRRTRRRKSLSDPLPEDVLEAVAEEAAPKEDVEAGEVTEVKAVAEEAPAKKAPAKKAPAKKATAKKAPAKKNKTKKVSLRLSVGLNRFKSAKEVTAFIRKATGMKSNEAAATIIKARSSHVEVRSDKVDEIIDTVHGLAYNGLTLKLVHPKK
jgi:ATP-dependent RNA helicase DeaD